MNVTSFVTSPAARTSVEQLRRSAWQSGKRPVSASESAASLSTVTTSRRDAAAAPGLRHESPGPGQISSRGMVAIRASRRLWPAMGDVIDSRSTRPGCAAGRRSFRRCTSVASLARSKGRGRFCTGLLIAALLGAGLSRAFGQQAAGSSCPVSLVYAADLGPGGAHSKNPTFAGRVNITNTASQVAIAGFETCCVPLHNLMRSSGAFAASLACVVVQTLPRHYAVCPSCTPLNSGAIAAMQVAVQSCKIGWNFTDGESIVGRGNVSAPFVADSLAVHQVCCVPLLLHSHQHKRRRQCGHVHDSGSCCSKPFNTFASCRSFCRPAMHPHCPLAGHCRAASWA